MIGRQMRPDIVWLLAHLRLTFSWGGSMLHVRKESTLFCLGIKWLVSALHHDGVDDDEEGWSKTDGVEWSNGIVCHLLAQEHQKQGEVGYDGVDVWLILFGHN